MARRLPSSEWRGAAAEGSGVGELDDAAAEAAAATLKKAYIYVKLVRGGPSSIEMGPQPLKLDSAY